MSEETPTYLLLIAIPTPELAPKNPNSVLTLIITEIAPGRLTAMLTSGTGLFEMGGPAAGLVGTELPECGSLRALEAAAKLAFEEWKTERMARTIQECLELAEDAQQARLAEERQRLSWRPGDPVPLGYEVSRLDNRIYKRGHTCDEDCWCGNRSCGTTEMMARALAREP